MEHTTGALTKELCDKKSLFSGKKHLWHYYFICSIFYLVNWQEEPEIWGFSLGWLHFNNQKHITLYSGKSAILNQNLNVYSFHELCINTRGFNTVIDWSDLHHSSWIIYFIHNEIRIGIAWNLNQDSEITNVVLLCCFKVVCLFKVKYSTRRDKLLLMTRTWVNLFYPVDSSFSLPCRLTPGMHLFSWNTIWGNLIIVHNKWHTIRKKQ